MSVQKNYRCDLCASSITDANGIAIIHRANGDIKSAYLHNEGAGHHLCNSCVKGLRAMIAGLDQLHQLHEDRDRAEQETKPTRSCACHPEDNPPVPCPGKHALSDCQAAAERAYEREDGE